jgi:hypothetical protein
MRIWTLGAGALAAAAVALSSPVWLTGSEPAANANSRPTGVLTELDCGLVSVGFLDYVAGAPGDHAPLVTQATRWLERAPLRERYQDLRARVATENADSAVVVLQEADGEPRAALSYRRAEDGGWLQESAESC